MAKNEKELAYVIYDFAYPNETEDDAKLIRQLEKFFIKEVDLVLKPVDQLPIEEKELNAFEQKKGVKPGMLMLLTDNLESVLKAETAGLPVAVLVRNEPEEGSPIAELWEEKHKEAELANGHSEVARALHLLVLKAQQINRRVPAMRAKKIKREVC